METLELLGVALGLASLAGVNLYLTVFVTGLAVQQQWIHLSPTYQSLEVLGHPAIVTIAGILYFVEFFADKIPWLDSLWDTIHTAIRPIGGAFLAIQVLGDTHPVMDVLVALLAGSMSLATHSVKAGTRLVTNTSPEPFSNIGLSIAEDIGVLGGLVLISYSQILALIAAVFIFATILYFLPGIFRSLKVQLWLIWKKLNYPAAGEPDSTLPNLLPPTLPLNDRLIAEGFTIKWAVPCIVAASPHSRPNRFGFLVSTQGFPGSPARLYFTQKNADYFSIELPSYTIAHESKFLSENLLFKHPEKRKRIVFLFSRQKKKTVEAIAADLQNPVSEEQKNSALSLTDDPT